MEADRVVLGGGRRRGVLSGRSGWLIAGLCGAGLIVALLHALWGPLGLRDQASPPPFSAASFPPIPATPLAARIGIPDELSCAGAGNCVAALRTDIVEPPPPAEVAAQIDGRWGAVDQLSLPAGAAANTELQIAHITSVSCPSIGGCVAVGQYTDSHGSDQGMVAAESHGVWQRARELQLPANANSTIGDEAADAMSVSCSTPLHCVAVGIYNANSNPSLAMAATERRGRWGRAVQIELPPGARTSFGHEIASLVSVSCAGSGECVATGQYNDDHNDPLPMVVTEINGKWARAIGIKAPVGASTATVGLGPVACESRGNCIAIGYDGDSRWILTALESNGSWRTALAPSTARASGSILLSLSCRADGCVAVGQQSRTTGGYPVVTTEKNGVWTTPQRLSLPPNAAPSNHTSWQNAYLLSVSCTGRDRCTAVGLYDVPYGPRKLDYSYRAPISAVETHGHWSNTTPLFLSPPAHARRPR